MWLARLLPTTLLLSALLLLPQGEAAQITEEPTSFDPTWAKSAFASFVENFWSAEQRYLLDRFPSNGEKTQYWTGAQGFDTLIDGAKLFPDQELYKSLVAQFYETQNSIGWFPNDYDDENWMGLALVRAYELTGDQRYLNMAVSLWKDITNAWDTSCCGSIPGGLWWDKSHSQKATASNAGPVILSLKLFKYFPSQRIFLTFADQVYNYWLQNMVNPSTFQVADHFEKDGSKIWWKYTYNEGLMIGASAEMYAATKNITFLSVAQRMAAFVLENEVTHQGGRSILFDGTGCQGDCIQFKGPAFRYLYSLFQTLAELGSQAPIRGPSAGDLRLFLQDNVEALWENARNGGLDLFAIDWAGPAPVPSIDVPVFQSQQNSATMALLLFASA